MVWMATTTWIRGYRQGAFGLSIEKENLESETISSMLESEIARCSGRD